MRAVDADKIKGLYPNRKSLNMTLDNTPTLSVTEQIERIKEDMCDNYCKMPYKYSAGEWLEICFSEESPCIDCPLNKL